MSDYLAVGGVSAVLMSLLGDRADRRRPDNDSRLGVGDYEQGARSDYDRQR